MRRGPCSNRRSRSTRTTPMRWRAKPTTYMLNMPSAGRTPRPTTMQKYSVRPTEPSRSLPTTCGPIGEKRLSDHVRAARMRRSAPPTPGSRSIRITPLLYASASYRRNLSSAISNKQIRCAASHAAESTRSAHWPLARLHGLSRTWPWAFRRRDRRMPTRRSTPAISALYAYLDLAAAYALKGKMDEAKTALAEARRLNPKLTRQMADRAHADLQPAFDGCARRGCRRSECGSRTRQVDDHPRRVDDETRRMAANPPTAASTVRDLQCPLD